MKKGFSLLELLLTIAILASLASIVVFALRPADALSGANATKNKRNAKDIEKAIEAFSLDNGGTLPVNINLIAQEGYYDICKKDVANGTDGCISIADVLQANLLSQIPSDSTYSTNNVSGFKFKYNPVSKKVTVLTYEEYLDVAGSGATLAQGLSGYWKFDEVSWNGTAGEVLDDTAYNNDGIASGAITTTGKYLGAGSFNGISNVIDFPNSAALSPATGVSVAGWFNPAESFAYSRETRLGILDKKDYKVYLDKKDGELKWIVNNGDTDTFEGLSGPDHPGIIVGAVNAMVTMGSDLYIGGNFIVAGGVHANRIIRWDGTEFSPLLGAGGEPGVNNTVDSLAVYNNELYIGGSFTTAGGATANRIVKWNGSSFVPLIGSSNGMNSNVTAMTEYNSLLYISGYFTNAGGLSVDNIASWNGTSFATPAGNWTAATEMEVMGSDLYLAGSFASFGGITVNNVVKWNGSAFSALGSGTVGVDASVSDLQVWNNNLYIGGIFSNAGGAAASKIVKWDGSAFSTLGTGANNTVYGLGVWDNNLCLTGAFSTAGGVTVNRVAKWDGSSFSALGGGVGDITQWPKELISYAGSLYVGGDFKTVESRDIIGLVRWDGTQYYDVGSGVLNAEAVVEAVAEYSGDIYIGGAFVGPGGVSANRIAKWDGQNFSPLGSGLGGGWPKVMKEYKGNLYIGGSFWSDGLYYIAKWDGATLSTFVPGSGTNAGANNQVNDMEIWNGDLYITGNFTTLGGVTVNRIARFDGTTVYPLGDGTGLSGYGSTLTVWNNELYIGGSFVTAGGVTVNNIAKWNGSTFSALSTGTAGSSSYVWASDVYNNEIYFGGAFTTAGGVTVNRITKWNGSSFAAMGGGTVGTNMTVYTMAAFNGKLYLGGNFTTAGGVTVNNIATWNGSAFEAMIAGGVTGSNALVEQMEVMNDLLYVVGDFERITNKGVFRVAKFGNVNREYVTSTSNSWNAGNWYHFAGTYDGTQVKLYINGVLQASKNVTSGFSLGSTGNGLKIGRLHTASGNDGTMKGLIDDVRVYDRAITSDEVTGLYTQI